MRRLAFSVLLLSAFTAPLLGQSGPPRARVEPVQETYFGTTVTDPYRWMEKTDNPRLDAWMKAQNNYTHHVLAGIPGRASLEHRIAGLASTATSVMNVQQDGTRVFYLKSRPGDANYRLYVREGWHGSERVLVDPLKISTANLHYSIDYYHPSWDGRWVAYGMSPGGSEASVIHVVEVRTGREQAERIDRAENDGVAWCRDNQSFYYNRLQPMKPGMAQTEVYQKSRVYLHHLGQNPGMEKPIAGSGQDASVPMTLDDTPLINIVPGSDYAFLQVAHGVQNEMTLYATRLDNLWPYPAGPCASAVRNYVLPPRRTEKWRRVEEDSIPWQKICDVEDEVTHYDVHQDDVYLLTHKNASHYEVIRRHLSPVSEAAPSPCPSNGIDMGSSTVVVPASDGVIVSIGVAADALYVQDLDAGLGRLRRTPWGSTTLKDIPLPFTGAVADFDTDSRYPGLITRLTAWTHCPLWYRYDPHLGLVNTALRPVDPVDFSSIEALEVRATSADGSSIPLSILRRKGLRLDGSHPTLLDGYGAYGITLDPSFDPPRLAWLEKGGVLAISHVRGGGEFGEDWHVAGMKLTKQHTIDDFIACAQYLIDHHYCTPATLAGEGTSAGGITIGGAITQRPELFGAALIRVGAVNTTRDEFTPNGPPNIPEFGSVKTLEGFQALYAMDAYLHVKDNVPYPAVMVTTGINDPRVASWEPAKMAARLQAATSSKRPVLLRVDYDAGHGMGSTITQRNQQRADEWAFLLWQLGQPGFHPGGH